MIAAEKSKNITVTESTIFIFVIEPQTSIIAADAVTCITTIQSVSYIVPIETASCRIDYIKKLLHAEMVPVRNSFSYNKEIERISKQEV